MSDPLTNATSHCHLAELRLGDVLMDPESTEHDRAEASRQVRAARLTLENVRAALGVAG